MKLLQEVAGTTVYFEKYPKVQVLFDECDVIFKLISQLVEELDDRYKQFCVDKNELDLQEKCNREHKALERVLHKQDLEVVAKKIERVSDSSSKTNHANELLILFSWKTPARNVKLKSTCIAPLQKMPNRLFK